MIRIFDRSCAITNSVGALKLDTTVLPTSTCLKITMPSMGDSQRAAGQIQLRVLERRLAREQPGARLLELRFDLVVVGLSNEVFLAQVLQALRAQLHERGCRLRRGEIGLRLRHALLVGGRVDAREHLPFLHRAVEVDVHLRHEAGDLRADFDADERCELGRWCSPPARCRRARRVRWCSSPWARPRDRGWRKRPPPRR